MKEKRLEMCFWKRNNRILASQWKISGKKGLGGKKLEPEETKNEN
jgi:hypothetical protein